MTPDPQQKRRHLSLTIKLVAWVGLFSTLFTLVMTVTLVMLRYQEEKALAIGQVKFIANSYNKSLANSLWEIDMVGAKLQMEAISQFPMVGHALLTTSTGQKFHLHKKHLASDAPGGYGDLFWQEKLISPVYATRVVGQLTVYVDEAALIAQVRTDASRILVGEIIKGFLLGLLITWLTSRLVTRHLSNLARQAAALTPSRLDEPIILKRDQHHHEDELDQLCDAFNQLHHNLVEYTQREEKQSKMVNQEKLAALGSLVAGIAHELNTPLGNSLMMASALLEKTEKLRFKMDRKLVRQSDLGEFLRDSEEASGIIMRGLSSAAELINDFKQVAVDRTTQQRRVFNLQQTIHELVSTITNQIRTTGHIIELDIPDKISMNSYPGPLGQVITNLINNALLHAFEGQAHGIMRITAESTVAGRIQIRFHDNGAGIAGHNLKRIFDPFFTTKMGQGRGGLGLNICYNIITTLLDGHISVESTQNQHTTFTLDLPLVAPQHT